MTIKIQEVTEQQYITQEGMGIPEDSYFCNDCWFEEDTDNLLGFNAICNNEQHYYKVLYD